ncbi:MAG TPA: hydroxyisourate hydrolase [Casimicrobiaceae bacterium]|nr:hydroxyisourate hydrolase [Casimicrobiaceae bacterium]
MSSSGQRLRIEVVDTTRDCGAAGMRVDVFTLGAQARKLCGGVVNAEGVVDAAVLASDAVVPGEYEVVFHIGAYFRGRVANDDLPFLDTVPFRFALPSTRRYLLPVRVAPSAFALASPTR